VARIWRSTLAHTSLNAALVVDAHYGHVIFLVICQGLCAKVVGATSSAGFLIYSVMSLSNVFFTLLAIIAK